MQSSSNSSSRRSPRAYSPRYDRGEERGMRRSPSPRRGSGSYQKEGQSMRSRSPRRLPPRDSRGRFMKVNSSESI